MLRRIWIWLRRRFQPWYRPGASWTIERFDRCVFRENGQLVYRGPLSEMPPDIRRRWDQAHAKWTDPFEAFRKEFLDE